MSRFAPVLDYAFLPFVISTPSSALLWSSSALFHKLLRLSSQSCPSLCPSPTTSTNHSIESSDLFILFLFLGSKRRVAADLCSLHSRFACIKTFFTIRSVCLVALLVEYLFFVAPYALQHPPFNILSSSFSKSCSRISDLICWKPFLMDIPLDPLSRAHDLQVSAFPSCSVSTISGIHDCTTSMYLLCFHPSTEPCQPCSF